MASFYGRQQTADKGTNQAPTTATASPSTCLKSCERIMSQCLVDATTFQEKERCRDRHDICSGRCGAMKQPTVTSTATPLLKQPTVTSTVTPLRPPPEDEVPSYPKPPKTVVTYPKSPDAPRGGETPCKTDCANKQYNCLKKYDEEWCTEEYDACMSVCQGGEGQCVHNKTCSGKWDCGGKYCATMADGKTKRCDCTKDGDYKPPKPGVCVEGAACTDASKCQPGGSCIGGKCHCKSGSCTDDARCIKLHGAGWYCYKTKDSPTGICKQKGTSDCTPGKKCTGPKRPNSQCGGLTCFRPKSWDGKDESVPGTCYCNTGPGQDEKKDGGGKGGGLGEYQWPSELTDLYGQIMGKAGDYLNMDLPEYALPPDLQRLRDSLIGRGSEYLGRKPGYSQSALDAMFGKGYENVRNLGASARQQAEAGLQQEGMLGTGAGQAALRQIPWQTEKNISDVVRDVFLGNEEQKRKDLESYTNMASGLFGQGVGTEQMIEGVNVGRRGEERDYTQIANQMFGSGMGYNQILESINASRRGEGQNALAMMMQYIMSLMSSWKS